MTTDKVPFYVINLDGEKVRWRNCELQGHAFDLNLLCVSAVTISELSLKEEVFVSNGVRAVWRSHMKCLQLFLSTNATHALILEDDFQVNDPKKLRILLDSKEVLHYDLIQLGFLKPGPDIAIRVLVANIETCIFKILAKIGSHSFLKSANFTNRLRVKEAREIPSGFTADDFQPGAHCYLISRKLAISVLKMNNPQFLCIDDFFTALSQMRSFRSMRIRKSIVSQAPFPKWTGERFLQN
jgi:GR25 family glycosyltransferase involved in LPS biosynthesis